MEQSSAMGVALGRHRDQGPGGGEGSATINTPPSKKEKSMRALNAKEKEKGVRSKLGGTLLVSRRTGAFGDWQVSVLRFQNIK